MPKEAIGKVDVRRFTYFLPKSAQNLAYGAGMRDNMRASLLTKMQVPLFVPAQVLATRRILKEKGCEVVNSHWMVPQGLSTAFLRRRNDSFRHVLQVHAGDVYLLTKLPFGKALARYIFGGTDFIFADGSHVRDTLDELLGEPSGAVLRCMGVDTALFGEIEDEKRMKSPFPDGYLLFFGRLTEKKGVEYLLRALPKVLLEHPDVGLLIIGYGTLEEQLRRLAEELGITERARFLGRQSHEEIVRYLHGCRLAVVPSIIDSAGETEGMPTVVVESMAAGVRVVGSAVDGIPDVIENGVNGWLCRQKDPDDLADKILIALGSSDTDRMVASCLETSARSDWAEVARQYSEVFEQLLSSGDA